jgi:hypothetical protein
MQAGNAGNGVPTAESYYYGTSGAYNPTWTTSISNAGNVAVMAQFREAGGSTGNPWYAYAQQ